LGGGSLRGLNRRRSAEKHFLAQWVATLNTIIEPPGFIQREEDHGGCNLKVAIVLPRRKRNKKMILENHKKWTTYCSGAKRKNRSEKKKFFGKQSTSAPIAPQPMRFGREAASLILGKRGNKRQRETTEGKDSSGEVRAKVHGLEVGNIPTRPFAVNDYSLA